MPIGGNCRKDREGVRLDSTSQYAEDFYFEMSEKIERSMREMFSLDKTVS